MENHIQTLSTSITNILTELARISSMQAAPLASPPPPAANNHEILRQLQEISSEIGHLRSHFTTKELGQIGQDCSSNNLQQTIINNTNLENLMELKCKHGDSFKTTTAEEYNQLARRYNSNLQHTYDCLMPLHNKRNNCIFGFPTMLGDLVSLDATAKELLCGALGIPDTAGEFDFAAFCGCNSVGVETFSCFGPTASKIASDRMLARHQRALDLVAYPGPPTADTRQYAENYNRLARKQNAVANDYSRIKPLLDERGLVVPGFPDDFEWFSRIPKQDVLWLLGEYGLDMAEEGCLVRFKEFVGVQGRIEREGEVEWFL